MAYHDQPPSYSRQYNRPDEGFEWTDSVGNTWWIVDPTRDEENTKTVDPDEYYGEAWDESPHAGPKTMSLGELKKIIADMCENVMLSSADAKKIPQMDRQLDALEDKLARTPRGSREYDELRIKIDELKEEYYMLLDRGGWE